MKKGFKKKPSIDPRSSPPSSAPSTDDALPKYLSVKKGHVALSVKVQPRSSKDEIIGEMNHELRIKLKAPPVDSAANNTLILFLAETLNCSRSHLQLALGHTSRHKTIHITNLPAHEIAATIRAASAKN